MIRFFRAIRRFNQSYAEWVRDQLNAAKIDLLFAQHECERSQAACTMLGTRISRLQTILIKIESEKTK